MESWICFYIDIDVNLYTFVLLFTLKKKKIIFAIITAACLLIMLMNVVVPHFQNTGVLFNIQVNGGSGIYSYLSPEDKLPLYHPAVEG